MFDLELVLAPRLVEPHANPCHDELAVSGDEPQCGVALSEHGAAYLGIPVLQGEVPMARGRAREVGEFTLHPQGRHAVLDQQPDLAVEASDGVNISLGCRHEGEFTGSGRVQ